MMEFSRTEQPWSVDGSVLDNLLKKTGLLQKADKPILAGKITAAIDIITQVPAHIWYKEDAKAHDQTFWGLIFKVLEAETLLLLDKGYIDYAIFDRLSDEDVGFVTRMKKNASYKVIRVLRKTENVQDLVIQLGSKQNRCQHEMRLVKVCFRGRWYCYLTNVVDSEKLPKECVVALYDQRWRIEDAFNVVKRLHWIGLFLLRLG